MLGLWIFGAWIVFEGGANPQGRVGSISFIYLIIHLLNMIESSCMALISVKTGKLMRKSISFGIAIDFSLFKCFAHENEL